MTRFLRPLTDPGEVMPMGTSSDKPERVICWSVALTEEKGVIDIRYSRAWAFDRAGKDIDFYLSEYARDPDTERGRAPNQNSHPKKPKTTMSIEYDRHAYFVFITENKNLYFSSKVVPFQVQKDNTTPDNDAYYTNAVCAWEENGVVKIDKQAEHACRVASFIANAKADQTASPNPKDFQTSFNMYFDIAVKSNGVVQLLPIIIDPDVGYPGGNTVGP